MLPFIIAAIGGYLIVDSIKPQKFKAGGLVAPNGKKSNLTPEQYKLVRTPEFKAWFGDWEKVHNLKIKDPAMDEITLQNLSKDVSKVVDENGEPLVVYHGSRAKNEFHSFKHIFEEKLDWTKDSFGFYFTDEKDYAEGYGERIFECFLNIRNPKISVRFEHTYLPSHKFQGLIKDGYDGIYFGGDVDEDIKNIEYKKEIVAFEPNQIKLADGSNTTFDASKDDIRYAKGGLIAPNGKKSNLTSEQYKLVRTKAFKNWFGDWENSPETSSKVVDENGEPLICFHGTKKGFNKFNSKYSNQGGVFWFSSDKDKIERGDAGAAATNVIITVFINAKKLAGWDEYEKKGLGQIEEMGFNAIKLDDDFVVFEPTQIKLADGSNTTFDSNNPDIRYGKGGEIEINDFATNSKFKVSKSNDFKYFNINEDKQIRITKRGGKYNKGYRVTLHDISEDGISYKSEYLKNELATDLLDAKKIAGKIYFDEIRKEVNEEIDISDNNFDYSKISTDELKKLREKTNDFSEMENITKELNNRKTNPNIRYKEGGEVKSNFKKWFGNSKVVDKKGKPKKMYHGTRQEFTEFKKGVNKNTHHSSASLGFFFGDYRIAQMFAYPYWGDDDGSKIKQDYYRSRRKELKIKELERDLAQTSGFNYNKYKSINSAIIAKEGRIDNEWGKITNWVKRLDYGTGANLMPVYLSIQNPFDMTFRQILDLQSNEKSDNLRKKLIKEGFDGIRILPSEESSESEFEQYVAFYPTQIKSAISNTTFDSGNPDIRYKDGGSVKISETDNKYFWGNVGAGILPICKKTGRILLNLRSSYVLEPNTYGVYGGKLDGELENEVGVISAAKREFYEETRYDGEVDIIKSYVYKYKDVFTYYNFIGIISDEFVPELDWESDGYKWVTLKEFLEIEPKHFGLKELINNDIKTIKKYAQ